MCFSISLMISGNDLREFTLDQPIPLLPNAMFEDSDVSLLVGQAAKWNVLVALELRAGVVGAIHPKIRSVAVSGTRTSEMGAFVTMLLSNREG